jgi:hypothetical protein
LPDLRNGQIKPKKARFFRAFLMPDVTLQPT